MDSMNSLPDLETNLRVFDSDPPQLSSPVKRKAKELHNKVFLLSKRQSNFFDEDLPQPLPNNNSPFGNAFSFPLEPLRPPTDKDIEEEERDISFLEADSSAEKRETSIKKQQQQKKEKPEKKETGNSRNFERITQKEAKQEETFNSGIRKVGYFVSKGEKSGGGKGVRRKRSGEELNEITTFSYKYKRYVKERQESMTNQKNPKRNNTFCKDRPYLRAKVNKVQDYWRRTNTSIPQVFHILSFNSESKDSVLEIQDLSLKGNPDKHNIT